MARASEASHPAIHNADFAVEIDYERNSPNPARVFKAMSGLIDTFEDLDRGLVKSVDVSIEPLVLLEDVEASSLKAWLRSVLDSVDDTALKEGDWKKVVGTYLYRAKKLTVEFLDKEPTISSSGQLEQLEGKLLQIAQETGVRHIPAYRPISRHRLLESIQGIHDSLGQLTEGDQVSILSPDGERTGFNMALAIAPTNIHDLLIASERANTNDVILKVKKPDFLGDSKWQFVHEVAFEASIEDEIWLERFKARLEPIAPGDALDASLQTVTKYDSEGNLIATIRSVLKVHKVIPAIVPKQSHLLEE